MKEDSEDWVADTSSEECLLCLEKYDLVVRRHHCRACGNLICNACSTNATLCDGNFHRLCVICYSNHGHLVPRRVEEVPRKLSLGPWSFSLGEKKIDPEEQLLNVVLRDDPNLFQILYTQFVLTNPDTPVADYGRTALHISALTNKVSMVEHLLSKGGLQGSGANVGTKTTSGKTALHYALIGNNAKIVGLLLDAGAAVGAVDDRGATALHLGCKAGSLETVKLMLSRLDADINTRDMFGRTPMHYAAENLYDDPALVTLLMNAGAPTDANSEQRETPLHIGASANNVECMVALFKSGATNMEHTDEIGRTPLLCAAESAAVNATVYLLKIGANLHAKDESGRGFTDLSTVSGGATFVALFEVASLVRPAVSLKGGSIFYPNLDVTNATLLFPVNVGVLATNAKDQIVPRGKPSIVSVDFTNSSPKAVLFRWSTTGIGKYGFDAQYGIVPAKSSKTIRVQMMLTDSRLLSEIKADTIYVECISVDKPEMVDHKADWFWCRVPMAKCVKMRLRVTAKVSLATPGLLSL